MLYDRDTLQEIEDNVNLLEYVEADTDLVKRGKDYYAHCPLHVDKTPSLAFIPEKNMFYCHSCGVGGKIIKYLQIYEGLSKDEAIQKAAKLSNTDLSKMCRSETLLMLKKMKTEKNQAMDVTPKRNVLDVNILKKYTKEYPNEWLEEGITKETMDVYQIMIDKSADRIVYPVFDNEDKLVNVKGRTRNSLFKELGISKYMNYYHIGTIDYFQGMQVAREFIQEKKEIIIFESIKSAMKCYSWGYKNCVSAESHGLTRAQIKILISLGVDIIFAFDSDVDIKSKECKGLRKSIRKLKNFAKVYVITDPENLLGGAESKNSPADCGKDIWETLYANKVSWESFDR